MCVQYCSVANSLDAEIGLALSNNHLCSEKLEVVNNRIEDLRKQVSVSLLHFYLYTQRCLVSLTIFCLSCHAQLMEAEAEAAALNRAKHAENAA